MELQFDKTTWNGMQRVSRQTQTQEQTQEFRLPDGMPDIGRVTGAWGQVLLRGKEWRTGGAGVSGGVMAWVLYEPEEEGPPQWVEAWIPFQMKWDFPETQHDGTLVVSTLLRSMDARSISARKMMLRSSIHFGLEALAPGELTTYTPSQLPDDVQLLQRTYPICMPEEAGEKPFALDEELTLPVSTPKIEKVVRYSLTPELIDRKVMADKLVFRGTAYLHVLYQGENGELYSWDFEIPFSQYGELNKEYEPDATARIAMAVTSLELEQTEEGNLRLKAGMTAQYVVYACRMVELVEDAYSPRRNVSCRTENFSAPMILEDRIENLRPEVNIPSEGIRIADAVFYPDYPYVSGNGENTEAELSGMFQMLTYDAEGNLSGNNSVWEDKWHIASDSESQVELNLLPGTTVQGSVGGGSANLYTQTQMAVTTTARQGIPMVTGLELGEWIEPEDDRPSLILRRVGENGLWDMAKSCGSTVEAIRNANQLQDEPMEGQMLIIPIA